MHSKKQLQEEKETEEIRTKDFFVVFQNRTPHKHWTFGVFS